MPHRFHLNDIGKVLGQELKQEQDLIVPNTPAKFFDMHISALRHPDAAKPPSKLFSYQLNFMYPRIKHRFKMLIKSHKIGLSTSTLIEDLWHAMYDCAGYDTLIIAQKQQLANEHLQALHRLMIESKTLKHQIIKTAEFDFLKTERTKAEMLYIKTPYSNRPSRIISLPFSMAAIESWHDVKCIHMSDVAINDMKNDNPVFGAATSRILLSRGWFTVETIPGYQHGWVYDTFNRNTQKDRHHVFYTKTLTYDVAIEAGLITEEDIENERHNHPTEFPRLYEGVFMTTQSAAIPASLVDETFSNTYDLEF